MIEYTEFVKSVIANRENVSTPYADELRGGYNAYNNKQQEIK